MKRAKTSLLGYALIGLVHQKPQSGYELRKVFADTAMGNYSDSPGAIYPALQRLEKSGDVTARVEEAGGLRRRRIYRVTGRGTAKLREWLARPIAPEDVKRGAAELLLRFSFMETGLGQAACVSFLREFEAAITPYIVELETFLESKAAVMPLSARLALDNGIRGYRSMRDWAVYAADCYRRSNQQNAKQRQGKRTERSIQ